MTSDQEQDRPTISSGSPLEVVRSDLRATRAVMKASRARAAAAKDAFLKTLFAPRSTNHDQ